MKPKVLKGRIVLRHWDQAAGLTETAQLFGSLDELYAHCLATTDPHLIDRIVIQGEDENGKLRLLTFVFQSITVSSEK